MKFVLTQAAVQSDRFFSQRVFDCIIEFDSSVELE